MVVIRTRYISNFPRGPALQFWHVRPGTPITFFLRMAAMRAPFLTFLLAMGALFLGAAAQTVPGSLQCSSAWTPCTIAFKTANGTCPAGCATALKTQPSCLSGVRGLLMPTDLPTL